MAEHDLEMNGVRPETKCRVLADSTQVHSDELETLVVKFGSMMLPDLPGVIIPVCFKLLLQLHKDSNLFSGELVIMVAELFLVLAVIFSLLTWLFSQEWGNDVVATSRQLKKVLAAIESCSSPSQHKFPALTDSEDLKPVRHFSLRYLTLAVMRMVAYIFCFPLGCIWAGFGIHRLAWHQCWLPLIVALLSSLLITIIVFVHIYQSYRQYRGSLTRLLASTRQEEC